MPSDTNILAFQELRAFLSGERLSKTFKQELGTLAIEVDNIIRHRVFEVYKVDQNKLKSASSVAGIASITTIGANVFKASLLYKHKPTPLASFVTDNRWGNINPATRVGLMQFVSVKRGVARVSRGYEHRGGFIPMQNTKVSFDKRTKKNTYVTNKQTEFLNSKASIIRRTNLYERKSPSPMAKLRLLFAPSPAQMVSYLVNNDIKLMGQIGKAEQTLIDKALAYYYRNKP